MFVVNNFLFAIAKVLDFALNIYMWVIIISALISWVSPDPYNPIVRFLYGATDPVLRPIRRRVGLFGGIDITPMIVIIIIIFLRLFLVRTLIDMSQEFR